MKHGAEALGPLVTGGISKGTPEVLMVCLARLMRWAIVASGPERRSQSRPSSIHRRHARSTRSPKQASARDGNT
jgi:hypothetical protein